MRTAAAFGAHRGVVARVVMETEVQAASGVERDLEKVAEGSGERPRRLWRRARFAAQHPSPTSQSLGHPSPLRGAGRRGRAV